MGAIENVAQPHFLSPFFQELWPMETDTQPQGLEETTRSASFQDGGPALSIVHSLQRGLDGQDRPQGRLSYSSSAIKISEFSPIPLERYTNIEQCHSGKA